VSADYEPVIGLEVHAQLLTETKLFCGCSTAFGRAPNSNVCPVCLGLPGSLPVINEGAVRLAVRAALALGCRVRQRSLFARKNYFYPDLPKGYQISQFEEPLAVEGRLQFELEGAARAVRIQRVHMEDDAGKNLHGLGGDSAVDLNRAGTPLVEIVTAPDLHSSAEAAAMMRALRDILLFIGSNDGNLEEGSLRCDANISLRPRGSQTLGTRCELKNLNSFRFVQRAIDVEIVRQTAILDAGGQIDQETRAFDPDTSSTRTLRSKEEAHDYRYFPEPDLPPLVVRDAIIDEERGRLGELPAEVRHRWTSELGLSPQAAATLTQHPAYVRLFEDTRSELDQPVKIANWLCTEVLRDARVHGTSSELPVSASQLAELLRLVETGAISGKQAKQVYSSIVGTARSPGELVAELGMVRVSDAASLEPLCQSVVERHPSQAAAFRAGKKNIMGFFVGQVMKETKGSADPRLVSEILERLIMEQMS
jgi:aspartyl-tRNA(Asn)/glutamyl-tRNA(Gln) amidotransferase subunit B